MRQITEPQLEDVFGRAETDIFAKFNCHRIGKIVSFDNTTFLASVQIVDNASKDTYDGNIIYSMPLLVDVPVFMPCNNAKGFIYPININDECLVFFNDRDIDNWFETGAVSLPKTGRMHHLSDGIAIVGLHSKIKPITSFDNNRVIAKYDTTIIELDNKIKIQNSAKNLSDLLDNLIDAIKNLKVQDGASELPLTASSIASLTSIANEFKELLK